MIKSRKRTDDNLVVWAREFMTCGTFKNRLCRKKEGIPSLSSQSKGQTKELYHLKDGIPSFYFRGHYINSQYSTVPIFDFELLKRELKT